MSTSSKIGEEARIEYESSFNIIDGEELMGTLSGTTLSQPFETSQFCCSSCLLISLLVKQTLH